MKYILSRLSVLGISLALISLAVFIVFQILPGNPAMIVLGLEADPKQLAALNELMGLDLPVHERYFNWIKGAVTGDFGISLKYNMPVIELIQQRLPVTAALGIMSIGMALFIGIPIGILVSKYSHTAVGRLMSGMTQISLAIPTFWLGLMLMLFFSVIFNLFPIGGYVSYRQDFWLFLKGLFLPALSMAIGNASIIIRFLKNSIQDNMAEDYVRTARSRGCNENRVLFTHVLRNAIMPIITITGMIAAETLSGSIIIENVFSLAGLGQLVVTSISARDLSLVQAVCLYIAFVVVVVNFIVDFIYNIVDPRLGS